MINNWTLNCKDMARLISRSMDETLPLRIRLGIKFHLMMCRLCVDYKDQLEFIRMAVAKCDCSQAPDSFLTPLPEDAEKKIKAHLCQLECELKKESGRQ